MTSPSDNRSARRVARRARNGRVRSAAASAPVTEIATDETATDNPRPSRGETLIAMMRADAGATAAALAAAVGWQVHSVRGFISGTLKKRADLVVTTTRGEGGTRYRVTDAEAASQ